MVMVMVMVMVLLTVMLTVMLTAKTILEALVQTSQSLDLIKKTSFHGKSFTLEIGTWYETWRVISSTMRRRRRMLLLVLDSRRYRLALLKQHHLKTCHQSQNDVLLQRLQTDGRLLQCSTARAWRRQTQVHHHRQPHCGKARR